MDLNSQRIRVIDLSLDIYNHAPAYPGDPECLIKTHKEIDSADYNLTSLAFSSHQGTHIDAPYHFLANGLTLEKIDLEKCMGWAVKVDLSSRPAGQEIGISDLGSIEISAGDIILIETGWDKYYGNDIYYSGYPGLTSELTDFLVEKKIKLLGVDMPNLNRGEEYSSIHHKLLQKGILIVESLANLNLIKAPRFYFLSWPLKITGGDGSPVRAAAIEYS